MTSARITLFNAIINPYEGKRPKVPEKKYPIQDMFERLSKKSFPVRLNATNNAQLAYIEIESIRACLPGGRGCVGRERMGKTLMNRQVAMVNKHGVRYNPTLRNSQYGLLELTGTLHYTDGKVSNIKIPVESSGVIGLRTGASDSTRVNSNKSIFALIEELETLLLTFLKIRKERPYKLIQMNAVFNMYTDKQKTNRPKIANLKRFLTEMHKGMNGYEKPKMPWLEKQVGPVVMKGIFKSSGTKPTITISAYGHVEIMGAKTASDVLETQALVMKAYKKLSAADRRVQSPEVKEIKPTKRLYVRRLPNNVSVLNTFVFTKKPSGVHINGKACMKHLKAVLQNAARFRGVSDKGFKPDICERLRKSLG